MTTTTRTVATPVGEAQIHSDRARRPIATLVLGHGAGKGVDAPDLVALAQALPKLEISVLRIQQPWVVAGQRVAARPDALDAATVACLNVLRVRSPLVLGGRSAGARVACRLAKSMGAIGCLALAFPLHPPGRPQFSRLSELQGSGVPTLVIQGARDPFGAPEEFPESTAMTVVPEADHSLKVPKRAELDQEQTFALVVEATFEWVAAQVG